MMIDSGLIGRWIFQTCTGALLMFAAGCGGQLIPGIQLGNDEGGSTYGLDDLPFEIQRADGTLLTGHAAVRILRLDFYTRDAKGLSVCSGGFTLDRSHAAVPISIDCTGVGILHGTVTIARADHGNGTFTERSGRVSTFRYGQLR
jgi:hypothetical protein